MKKLLLALLTVLCISGTYAQFPIVTHGMVNPPRVSSQLIIDSLSTSFYGVWSLRKIVSAYTGNAITVRRSNDNAETNIAYLNTNELDTASLKSFCGSNSGYVKTQYDQKGTANLTQTTNANQPRIVNAGVVERLNGRPAIRFLNASGMYFNLSYIGLTTGATFANAVLKGGTTTSTNGPIFGDFGTDGNADHWPYSDNTVYDGFARANRLTVGTVSTLASACILGIVSESNNYNLYTNNTSRYSSATGTSAIQNTTHRIGSSSRGGVVYWDGYIAELTLAKATPSSGDRTKLYKNQALYFTITVSP